MPMVSNGPINAIGADPVARWLSQNNPAAEMIRPALQIVAAVNHRVSRPATIGRTRSGADRATIIRPAATSAHALDANEANWKKDEQHDEGIGKVRPPATARRRSADTETE